MRVLRAKTGHLLPTEQGRCLFGDRDKASIFVRSALLTAISLCLFLSAMFVTQAGVGGKSVAISGSGVPVSARIDASGEEAIFQQSIIDPRLILAQEMPVIYGVDITEIYLDEQIKKQKPETDIYFDVLPEDIKMEILGFADDAPKQFYVGSKGPQILIYHTHTTEAYRQTTEAQYVETGSWRTEDERHSVIAVGRALKNELEEYGYTVMHDLTNHEPPSLNTSYTRSLVTMEKYAAEYPSIKVFIDVHRDAYGNEEAGSKDYVMVSGKECARVMFVVGTGDKYSKKPNYESNYKLALAVTNHLESIKKGFTRPIRVKTGRYNQQVSDMCLLIEVGHNANSLEQALNSVKHIALALSRVLDPG